MTQKEIDDLRAACILANAHSKQKREEEKREQRKFALWIFLLIAMMAARGYIDMILP